MTENSPPKDHVKEKEEEEESLKQEGDGNDNTGLSLLDKLNGNSGKLIEEKNESELTKIYKEMKEKRRIERRQNKENEKNKKHEKEKFLSSSSNDDEAIETSSDSSVNVKQDEKTNRFKISKKSKGYNSDEDKKLQRRKDKTDKKDDDNVKKDEILTKLTSNIKNQTKIADKIYKELERKQPDKMSQVDAPMFGDMIALRPEEEKPRLDEVEGEIGLLFGKMEKAFKEFCEKEISAGNLIDETLIYLNKQNETYLFGLVLSMLSGCQNSQHFSFKRKGVIYYLESGIPNVTIRGMHKFAAPYLSKALLSLTAERRLSLKPVYKRWGHFQYRDSFFHAAFQGNNTMAFDPEIQKEVDRINQIIMDSAAQRRRDQYKREDMNMRRGGRGGDRNTNW